MYAQVIPFDVQSDQLRKQISAELHTLHGSRHPHIVAYYASFLQVRLLSKECPSQFGSNNALYVRALCLNTCLLFAVLLSLISCNAHSTTSTSRPHINCSNLTRHLSRAKGLLLRCHPTLHTNSRFALQLN